MIYKDGPRESNGRLQRRVLDKKKGEKYVYAGCYSDLTIEKFILISIEMGMDKDVVDPTKKTLQIQKGHRKKYQTVLDINASLESDGLYASKMEAMEAMYKKREECGQAEGLKKLPSLEEKLTEEKKNRDDKKRKAKEYEERYKEIEQEEAKNKLAYQNEVREREEAEENQDQDKVITATPRKGGKEKWKMTVEQILKVGGAYIESTLDPLPMTPSPYKAGDYIYARLYGVSDDPDVYDTLPGIVKAVKPGYVRINCLNKKGWVRVENCELQSDAI